MLQNRMKKERAFDTMVSTKKLRYRKELSLMKPIITEEMRYRQKLCEQAQ